MERMGMCTITMTSIMGMRLRNTVMGKSVTAPPSPSRPARGRVPAGAIGVERAARSIGTSPLAGEDGRGGATRPGALRECAHV